MLNGGRVVTGHRCYSQTDQALRLEVLDALLDTRLSVALGRFTFAELMTAQVEAEALTDELDLHGLCRFCGRYLDGAAGPTRRPWLEEVVAW